MNMREDRVRNLIGIVWLTLVPSLSFADVLTPQTLFAGTVTCIPNAGNGCVGNNTVATSAQWRVINLLAVGGNGLIEDVPFLDAELVFTYVGGSTTWNWSAIAPLITETEAFSIEQVRTLTSLSFNATLPTTTLRFVNGDFFVLLDPQIGFAETSFPPPLDFLLEGTHVHPVPEPSTLLMLSTGALLLRRTALR